MKWKSVHSVMPCLHGGSERYSWQTIPFFICFSVHCHWKAPPLGTSHILWTIGGGPELPVAMAKAWSSIGEVYATGTIQWDTEGVQAAVEGTAALKRWQWLPLLLSRHLPHYHRCSRKNTDMVCGTCVHSGILWTVEWLFLIKLYLNSLQHD